MAVNVVYCNIGMELLHFRCSNLLVGSIYHVKNEGYLLVFFMMRYFNRTLSLYSYFMAIFNHADSRCEVMVFFPWYQYLLMLEQLQFQDQIIMFPAVLVFHG